MKISGFWRWCLIAFFTSIILVVLSIAFENVVDAVAKLRQHPPPETSFKPCEPCYHRHAQDADNEGCGARYRSYGEEPKNTSSGMNEITAAFIGAVVGAFLACLFSIFQRTYEQWMVYKGKIYMIQYRLARIEIGEHFPLETIRTHYIASLEEVTAAVCEVKPYLFFEWQRASLDP